MEKILNVLYQSDNNYAEVTGVSIVSLLENNKMMSQINVYLLNDNIAKENLERLQTCCDTYDRTLIIVDTKEILQKLKDLKVEPYKNTYTTYFKLFAIKNLELSTDRILQLDGDTVINHSLEELLEIDLSQKVCAATYDCILNEYKPLVGIPETETYYNCGVLLINQPFWREYKCEEKITNHLLKVRNRYFTVDQDIINVLFRDKIKYLHLKYNFNSGFYIYGIKESIKIYNLKPEYYSAKSLIEEAYQDPYIYHCMGAMTGRPWEQNNIHPQNEIYNKYLELSPWKDIPKKVKQYSWLFRVQRGLYQILPSPIYSPIHRIVLKRYLRKMNTQAMSR